MKECHKYFIFYKKTKKNAIKTHFKKNTENGWIEKKNLIFTKQKSKKEKK